MKTGILLLVFILFLGLVIYTPYGRSTVYVLDTPRPTTASSSTTTIRSNDTGSIGGGLLTAGSCASGTAVVAGAVTGMIAVTSPDTYPGDDADWSAYVSSANTVTVKICAIVAVTPTATVYHVRVIT